MIHCWTCGSVAWQGSIDPPADGQPLLTVFADAQCPRGGVGCPHTTDAREVEQAADPRARLARLESAAPEVGTVTAVTGNRVVVATQGGAQSLPRLASYQPAVGDTVQVAGPPTRRYVAGKIT